MSGLCGKHIAEWNAWSDYRIVTPLRIISHASYDDSVRGVIERRQRMVKEWRETIQFQQMLIKSICASQCQRAVETQVPAGPRGVYQ